MSGWLKPLLGLETWSWRTSGLCADPQSEPTCLKRTCASARCLCSSSPPRSTSTDCGINPSLVFSPVQSRRRFSANRAADTLRVSLPSQQTPLRGQRGDRPTRLEVLMLASISRNTSEMKKSPVIQCCPGCKTAIFYFILLFYFVCDSSVVQGFCSVSYVFCCCPTKYCHWKDSWQRGFIISLHFN